MARCVEWARSTGIVTRLELRVFTRNATAVRLYERFGFATEGVCRRAVFREGRYEDNLLMSLLL
jgi:putative acetyltransferase